MSLSKNHKLITVAKQLCRTLRKHSTNAEKIFWNEVRDRKFFNKKFYRQHPLFFDIHGKETFFIIDFFCFEEKIAIEIDGGYHERQREYDSLRTHIINNLNIKVIRFSNMEVENNIEDVLKTLQKYFTKN